MKILLCMSIGFAFVFLLACGSTKPYMDWSSSKPGKYYIAFETKPRGAFIYGGESPSDLKYIGITPHAIEYKVFDQNWKMCYYKFVLPGYEEPDVLHYRQANEDGHRYIYAELKKIVPDKQEFMPNSEIPKPPETPKPDTTDIGKPKDNKPPYTEKEIIVSKTKSGTGFFINSKGYLVSNDHVVKDCKRIDVVNPAVRSSAQVLFTDAKNDIAVLKVDGYQTQYGTFRSGKAARAGDDITTVGFPLLDVLGSDIKVTKGNISSMTGLNNDSSMLQFSAPIQPGNSGGPLLDAGGNVVGVVSSKLSDIATLKATGSLPQNVNFAIKNQVVQLFLESHGIEFTNRISDKNLGTAEVVDQARKYTLNVQCYE